MWKIFTIILFSFLLGHSLVGQNNLACDGIRYIDDVFSDVEVTTITYGSNTTFLGTNQSLKMDVYEPVGDVHEQRPVIIFAFGGSFIVGSRGQMASLCEQFAKKGYVAATIDYRLGFLGTNEEAVAGAVMRAVSDMKAAIRYFRMDADTDNTFKVHPDYILAGGLSAGAITALHATYLDEDDDISTGVMTAITANGGFNGNTGSTENQTYSSDIFAVYNLSGSLANKEYLGANETVPLVSFHGTDDTTVPFNSGLANGLATSDGSGLLHAQAELHGIPNYLKAVEGGGHTNIHTDIFYIDERDEFNNTAHIFFQNQMCPDFIISNTNEVALIQQSLDVFPNPSNYQITLDFGKLESDYRLEVFDQLGRRVANFENQNDQIFTLKKNQIGEGMFFVNVLFEDADVAPLTKRIVFN